MNLLQSVLDPVHFVLTEALYAHLFEMCCNGHEIVHQLLPGLGQVDPDGPAIVFRAHARDQADLLHGRDQSREGRNLDRDHGAEIAQPLWAFLPENRHDAVHGKGEVVLCEPLRKQLAHPDADAVEQVGQ